MDYTAISKTDQVCSNCRGEPMSHVNGQCRPKTPHELAREYGFRCRSSLDGYFLSEGHPAQFCSQSAGDDLIKISHEGMITLCVPDQPGLAQAYLCAIQIKGAL